MFSCRLWQFRRKTQCGIMVYLIFFFCSFLGSFVKKKNAWTRLADFRAQIVYPHWGCNTFNFASGPQIDLCRYWCQQYQPTANEQLVSFFFFPFDSKVYDSIQSNGWLWCCVCTFDDVNMKNKRIESDLKND